MHTGVLLRAASIEGLEEMNLGLGFTMPQCLEGFDIKEHGIRQFQAKTFNSLIVAQT